MNKLIKKYNIYSDKKSSTPSFSKQQTKTSVKKPDVTQPTFDLTSSPDISPVKKASPKLKSSFTKIADSHVKEKKEKEAVFDLTESPKCSPVKKDSRI